MEHFAGKVSPDLLRVALLMECTMEDSRGSGKFNQNTKPVITRVSSTIEKAVSSLGKNLGPLMRWKESPSTEFLGNPHSLRIAVP